MTITRLKKTHADIAKGVRKAIEEGMVIVREIRKGDVEERVGYDAAQDWATVTEYFLRTCFDDDGEITSTFRVATSQPQFMGETLDRYGAKNIESGVAKLKTVLNLLPILEAAAVEPEPPSGDQGEFSLSKVFIVHGHNNGAKQMVARFISKVGLQPIILHEQADAGATVIEKFEREADVGYAVVLMTADDEGYPKVKPDEVRLRARQNVIFELGYFAAKLGRNRIRVLYEDGVDIPSDIAGVLYQPLKLSDDEGWHLSLAREMKAAGLKVDESKLLG